VSDTTITFLILGAVIVVFVLGRLPVAVVVSESLDATRVSAWARQQLIALVGESRTG
jgi:hypothetical protein